MGTRRRFEYRMEDEERVRQGAPCDDVGKLWVRLDWSIFLVFLGGFMRRMGLWLAKQLGVSAPASFRAWVIALLLLPSPAQQIQAADLEFSDIPDLAAHLTEMLGIGGQSHIGHWLWHLFVLPSHQRSAKQSQVKRILSLAMAGMGWLLRQAWKPFRFVVNRLLRLLPTINLAAVERRAESWSEAPALQYRAVRLLVLAVLLATFIVVVTTPFSWLGQLLFLFGLWGAALYVRRMPGNLTATMLVLISLLATSRYVWWRVTQTLAWDSPLESVLSSGLFLAEFYAWMVLVLGYIQTIWPLHRPVAALPDDPALLPSVDIFIPTYNEPLKVVMPTVLAARGLDWPADKLKVYLLDDGRREEMRQFAAEAGVEYLTRSDNLGAKAGNLNHALGKSQGEFVAVFDCDHIPTRSFLQATMGWFRTDPRCVLVQTPHHFFSADPFEKNLDTFGRVPSENTLFYGLIQDTNDFWDATFFCGSCAVLRRAPLEAIGGIATETVTEDAHTALKLQRLGYTTAYINQRLAAGLATESLSGHVGQRIRWARGMAQIFRIDNPFLGKGLDFFQRICYGNAMLHFFYGLPRLVFLTAPLAFLYFHVHVIHASAVMIALYVLPHLIQSQITNAHIQGQYRHTFWAELYETVLAWYITFPSLLAIINPGAGKFNVTAKGGLIERTFFDWGISKPYLALVALNFSALVIGLIRFFLWNSYEQGTVAMNMIWTLYNLFILGAAIGVATETRQVRQFHRVMARLPVSLHLPDGRVVNGQTRDFSMSGLGLVTDEMVAVTPGASLRISLWRDGVEHTFPAKVVNGRDHAVSLIFEHLSIDQQAELVQSTFARQDAWARTDYRDETDRPLEGMQEIMALGIKGYYLLWQHLREKLPAWATPLTPAQVESR